ncbi:MAG: SGNH/GDSL hydrolase family protein [Planctomycetes bacterium]|nr:SGNH/GDSL hydrolase family protein [Planctomycetota bacterium]
MRRKLSIRKKLAFTGLICFLAFGACELYVRATRRHSDLWAFTGRSLAEHPMARWAQLDAFCAYRAKPGRYGSLTGAKTVNEHGLISTPSLSLAKPAGVTRVLFLGGSSTAGTGLNLDDQDTWPAKVIARLSEEFPKKRFQLINGALGGYSSFESFGRLTQRLRFFRPDVVIVYHGWNDLYYFGDRDLAHRWRTLDDGSWGFEKRPRKLVEPRFFDHLIWPSQVLTKVRIRLAVAAGDGEIGESRGLAPRYDKRAVEVWRENLRLIRGAAQTLGMELFVCKQATLVALDMSPKDLARSNLEYHGFDLDAHVKAFDALNRVLDEEFPKNRVIDARALSGVSENFHDHIHPTPLGATRVAEIVSLGILPYFKGDDGK